MNCRWRRARADLLLALALILLAAADVGLREIYHRVGAESVPLLSLVMVGSLLALFAALCSWRADASIGPAMVVEGARLAFVAALLFAWSKAIGVSPARLWDAGWLAQATVVGIALGGAVLIALALLGTPATWVRGRNALAMAFLLFEVSPVALGLWLPPAIAWPPGFLPEAAASARGREATLVLLLDELNANQAGRFVSELRGRGLQTSAVAVRSVGNSTQNVVPSLFSREVFSQARPCGPSTTCDGARALDFGRVTATRADVDVVGFFQPYCSMQGLRSCFRGTMPLAVFDGGRIRCGLWRRFGWSLGVDEPTCRAVYVRSWGDMTDSVIDAARRAPALTQGGLLFAHLPLPHPPGAVVERHLADHYRDNLDRAVSLVGELVGTAQAAGLRTQVLIFSDHPLRQAQWCASFAPYQWDGCKPDPSLNDDRVPLIAAGLAPPDLSTLTSNLNAFALISALR